MLKLRVFNTLQLPKWKLRLKFTNLNSLKANWFRFKVFMVRRPRESKKNNLSNRGIVEKFRIRVFLFYLIFLTSLKFNQTPWIPLLLIPVPGQGLVFFQYSLKSNLNSTCDNNFFTSRLKIFNWTEQWECFRLSFQVQTAIRLCLIFFRTNFATNPTHLGKVSENI